MRTNWLKFLCIVALVISTRFKPVDSASKTRHEETHSQGNIADKGYINREQKTTSSHSFLGFLDIFPHFLHLGSSPSVKGRVENKELPGTYPVLSNFANGGIPLEPDPGPSKKISLSENSPRALIRARDFRLSTPTEQKWKSLRSDGFPHPPSVLSSPSSQQSRVGVGDNAGASHSSDVRLGLHALESDERTFQKHREEQHSWSLGNFKSTPKLPLDRPEILLPGIGTATDTGEPKSQKDKRTDHENTNPVQVSGRIKTYAEKLSSIPEGKTFVKIGEANIPQEKVAPVGDVDGNKVQDYIVTNIAAKNYSGTVRLFLMGVEDKFLYTRELVPGKWGFEAADLKPGERYGDTVFRLPSTGNSSQCFIAITAPGDQTMKDTNGAVYILEISRKGNVNNHTKLSATAFLELVQEEMREELKTPADEAHWEQHSPSSPTLGLKHLNGVTSMVFFNSSGGVQAVINVKSSKEKDLLHDIDRHLQDDGVSRNTESVGTDSLPSRVASNGSCLFNTTHCACMPENRGEVQGDCYEMFESKEEPRRVLCLRKVCPPTHKCSCAGVERCRRVDRIEEVHVPHAREDSAEIYCTVEKRLVSKIVPITSS